MTTESFIYGSNDSNFHPSKYRNNSEKDDKDEIRLDHFPFPRNSKTKGKTEKKKEKNRWLGKWLEM